MESTAAIETAKHLLFSIGIVLAAGTISGFLAQKLRVPDLVLFLLAGMLLGPEVTKVINISDNSAFNQLVLIFGSSYIIFDGGAALNLKVLKQVWITVVALATVGVLITAAITGLAATYILGVPLIVGLLLGCTIASTDPATLVPIFKQLKVRDRVAQTVISESAFNDVMASIVTFTVLGITMGTSKLSFGAALLDLVQQSIIGIVAGGILGYLATFLIAHEKYAFFQEYLPLIKI